MIMKREKAVEVQYIGFILLGFAIAAELVFVYKDIAVWMKNSWLYYSPDRFGLYVTALFLCLFIYRILKNKNLKLTGSSTGLTVILCGAAIYLIGYLADVHIVQAATLIIITYGVVLYIMGIEWGRILLFPFLFLFLMLPTISFQIESAFGVILRSSITNLSVWILNVLSVFCETGNSILIVSSIEVPINYYRDSISSPLAFLILTCIAAEFIFYKNRYKISYVMLLWVPMFIVSHSIFTVTMVLSYMLDDAARYEFIWGGRVWLPIMIHTALLILPVILIKVFKLKKVK